MSQLDFDTYLVLCHIILKANKTFANTIGNISQLRNSNILKGVISDTDQSAYGLLLLSYIKLNSTKSWANYINIVIFFF